MKVTKPFCVDDDLIKDLQKVNASELVNELLREHFDGIDSMNLVKLKQLLSKKTMEKSSLLKEIRDFKRKIRQIEQKERKILLVMKKFDSEIVDIISNIGSQAALFAWYRSKSNPLSEKLRQLPYTTIKSIYIEVKGGKIQK